jgi:putative hemolysin
VVDGSELDAMDEATLAARIDHIAVFARVSPQHKVKIVRALKADGHIAAMTGDGVNDAPALKAADIGVAMGITGTAVTREAATLVLTDDNFATIVHAVKEGRVIYDNIVKFVRFQLSTNIAAILTVLAATLLGMPLPFTAIQLLWINIIMDGPPAMTLGVEPARDGLMREPPREPGGQILTGERLLRLVLYGTTMMIGTLGVFALSLDQGDRAHAVTMAFTTFVLFQFFNVFNARAEHDARKSRLQKLAENGDRSAALAIRLGDEPTRFLSTIQIGITAIGILNGIVGEAALAEPLAQLLRGLGLEARTSALGATAMVVVSITYFTIVIGELVPKRLAQLNAEGIARFLARPISLLASLSQPFVVVLSLSTDGVLRLLGKEKALASELTEDDIHAMLIEGSESGVIEQHEHELVRNVFRLDDRPIGTLMTPRSDIVYLDLEDPFELGLPRLIGSDHSRFPVCRGGLHEVLGVITAKRLLKYRINGGAADIADYLKPAVFVPETLTGMQLLKQLRESGVQMVFVVDEYGEMQGLITLQDVLQALVGEFRSHDPEDVWATLREDGSWLLDGMIPVPELKDRLDLKAVPEERARYNTLSGMMMCLFGNVPATGEVTEWEGWRLEVVDLDGKRIDKVLASRLPQTADKTREDPDRETDTDENH